MSRLSYRRAAFSIAALGSLVVACSEDSSLAPPDGSRCTAGSLSVGDTVSGEITLEDCLLWNDYDYNERRSESWTLRTAADRVYIIRLVPVAVDGGDNTLDANVNVYGRNEAGDPIFVSASSGSYGPLNLNSGQSREVILPSRSASTFSIRVSNEGELEVGGYELTVADCPLLTVALGVASAGVDLNNTCTTHSVGGQNPTPAAFFSFDARADVNYTIVGTRTAGTGSFSMVLRGPGLDFGCYVDGCTSTGSTSGPGPHTMFETTQFATDYTVMTFQEGAVGLSTSVRVVESPVALNAPSSLNR